MLFCYERDTTWYLFPCCSQRQSDGNVQNFRSLVPTQAVRIHRILHRSEPYEDLCPLGVINNNPACVEQLLVFALRSGSHSFAYEQAAEAEPALVLPSGFLQYLMR